MTTDIDYSGTVPTDVTIGQTPVRQSYPVDHWLTREEAKALIRIMAVVRGEVT